MGEFDRPVLSSRAGRVARRASRAQLRAANRGERLRRGPVLLAYVFLAPGVLTVLIPGLVGVIVGGRVFKMHPGVLFGVCAGRERRRRALAAIQEEAKSQVAAGCRNPGRSEAIVNPRGGAS